jgi:hypothetical protein
MFVAAPWADALYAIDAPWWKHYGRQVAAEFRGEKFSARHRGFGCRVATSQHFENSGTAALSLAAHFGARRILMAGYDCQFTGGKSHSHGDHPPTLGNAKSLPKWPENFGRCAAHLARLGVEVINCTRATALTCFPRGDLEQELARA